MNDANYCGLELGQMEVWLEDEIAFLELIDAIIIFFELKNKESVNCTHLDSSRVVDVGCQSSKFIRYIQVPNNLKGWLIESSFIKNKYAFCAFISGWILSRGKGEQYTGRHDAFVESGDEIK